MKTGSQTSANNTSKRNPINAATMNMSPSTSTEPIVKMTRGKSYQRMESLP